MSIIFSGFDIRGRLDDSLTPEYAWNVGKAFADWLPEDGSIFVMHENDATESIIKALTEGIRLQGRDVVLGGEGDAAAVAKALEENTSVGGLIVGRDSLQSVETIQLFQADGAPVTSENGLLGISALVDAGNFVPAAVKGEIVPQDK